MRWIGTIGMLLALAGGPPPVAGEDGSADSRVEWLRRHAVPLATIDPASPDLHDLEPLRGLLDGVRVVMLGQATLGDGNVFLAKTRLIRFLHQEMGFDVLVFDSGFYDHERAWQEIRSGADVRQTLNGALSPMYAEAQQFQPLLDLVAERAASERPLIMAGLDGQLAGPIPRQHLLADLHDALAKLDVDLNSVPGTAEAEAIIRDLTREAYAEGQVPVPEGRDRERFGQTLDALRRLLAPLLDRPASPGAPDVAFWLQFIDNLKNYAQASWKIGRVDPKKPIAPELLNLHERQMAENLLWLAQRRYPGRKLIVWSLTVHLARDLDHLSTGDTANRGNLDTLSTLGDLVSRKLGDKAFTMAFTSFEGSMGNVFHSPLPLLVPTPGSFEELMSRTGLSAGLVSLRRLPDGGGWLRRGLLARPVSYRELLGVWPQHLDALVFVRRLEPARRL